MFEHRNGEVFQGTLADGCVGGVDVGEAFVCRPAAERLKMGHSWTEREKAERH